MISLFYFDEIYPAFRKTYFDTLGEYTFYCRELSKFKYQHEFVMGVLFVIFWKAGVSEKK